MEDVEMCDSCNQRPAETTSEKTGARYCAQCAAWIFSGFQYPDDRPIDLEPDED